MKKIALISGNFFGQTQGGAELQLFLLANHLRRLGYRVTYVYIDDGRPMEQADLFDLRPIRKRKLLRRLFGQYFFLDALKLLRILDSIEPEFIIVRGGFAYVGIAARYCSGGRCRMAWQIASESDLLPYRPRLSRSLLFDWIDKRFLEYGIRHSDYVVGQAKYQDDLLRKNYRRRCDLIVANSLPVPSEDLEKRSPIKIVWIANFKAVKRPDIFVRLATELKSSGGAEFVMIGRDSSVADLKGIRQQIAAANIEYLGELPLEEVNRILGASHILVNTSEHEGFPNTFIQAWMRRVPVVSLQVDPDQVLVKEKIGFLSGDFGRMINDLKTLIQDRKLREDMGERARQFALKHYSPDNLKAIVDLIENGAPAHAQAITGWDS